MKTSLLLLVAAGSIVLPALTHAEPVAAKKAARNQSVAAPAVPKPDPDRLIYYINTEPATGSHIPRVSRVYHGRIDSASSPAIYGLTQIQQTGQLDVGSSLIRLDPSITLGGR